MGHGWNVGQLPFKTLGHSSLKVKNKTKDEENDGGVMCTLNFGVSTPSLRVISHWAVHRSIHRRRP